MNFTDRMENIMYLYNRVMYHKPVDTEMLYALRDTLEFEMEELFEMLQALEEHNSRTCRAYYLEIKETNTDMETIKIPE